MTTSRNPNIAILGATGAVGQEFIRLIEERNFPFHQLKLLASARSAGKKLMVCGKEYTVEEARPESFEGIDIALFAGGSISKLLAPEAVKRGAVVIDNSSSFRIGNQSGRHSMASRDYSQPKLLHYHHAYGSETDLRYFPN